MAMEYDFSVYKRHHLSKVERRFRKFFFKPWHDPNLIHLQQARHGDKTVKSPPFLKLTDCFRWRLRATATHLTLETQECFRLHPFMGSTLRFSDLCST